MQLSGHEPGTQSAAARLAYRRRMSLSWEEPPAPPRAEITLQDQLRARPGAWAKVLTSDKVSVSRLGGDLHREGFEIHATDEPDDVGSYSLYAQWNPGGRTTTVVRPGATDLATTETLRDDALSHLLAATVASARQSDAADLDNVLAAARQQVKALFTGADEARRYLQAVRTPPA